MKRWGGEKLLLSLFFSLSSTDPLSLQSCVCVCVSMYLTHLFASNSLRTDISFTAQYHSAPQRSHRVYKFTLWWTAARSRRQNGGCSAGKSFTMRNAWHIFLYAKSDNKSSVFFLVFFFTIFESALYWVFASWIMSKSALFTPREHKWEELVRPPISCFTSYCWSNKLRVVLAAAFYTSAQTGSLNSNV